MKAIVRQAFGGPEQLQIQEVPDPVAADGEVLVRVHAFGLNRAEQYFRQGLWGEVAAISGIECVGRVERDPSGKLQTGQTVMALMGGLGRWRPGSYAEQVCVPAANVVPVSSTLSWARLAALPETCATAWTCLFDNLALRRGEHLLVRGANSALGQAAIELAAQAGALVIGSVRDAARAQTAQARGARHVLTEGPALAAAVREIASGGLEAVLDLVGASSVRESLQLARRGGRVCWAGFLGGGAPLEALDPMRDLPSGRHLSFLASALVFGGADYPLSAIPFQQIVDRVEQGAYRLEPAATLPFERIQDAHRLLDASGAGGKIVVTL